MRTFWCVEHNSTHFSEQTLLVQAQANAEALKLQAQQISPLMIQYEMAKRWDGVYPSVYMATGGSGLPQLPPVMLDGKQLVKAAVK